MKETKRGLDTFLTRELDQDGKDFSGGEKQRLAMVRALYRNAPFLVLDEPTAAIDPIAEPERGHGGQDGGFRHPPDGKHKVRR